MNYMENSFPVPSDYFGILWALAGIKDAKVIEHGSTGTVSYNVVNFDILNHKTPKGQFFSSGIDEDDVIMGREDKLIQAVKELDREHGLKLLPIVATGVTSVIGLDLDGVAEELKKEVNAKILVFSGGGFRGSFKDGIEEVFLRIAKELVKEPEKKHSRAVNLLGVSIDTFNHVSDLHELKRLLSLLDLRVNTVFTQDTDTEAIEKMSEASINIVLNDSGIESAKLLEKRFSMPWVYGMPFGIKGTVEWIEEIADKAKVKTDKSLIANDIKSHGHTLGTFTSPLRPYNRLRVGVSGCNEYVKGLAYFLASECEMDVQLAVIHSSSFQESTVAELKRLGVKNILAEPDYNTLKNSIEGLNLHILFGNSYELKTAAKVPIKIHSAFPSFDYMNFHDGTPFVGFRGNDFLIQKLINSVNQHPEVWRI